MGVSFSEGSSMARGYSKLLLVVLSAMFTVSHFACNSGDEPPKNGPYVEYYENGKKWSETHYKNGKRDGLETEWYKNGQKSYEGHYKNGKPDGLETFWDESGQKLHEAYYKNGKEASRKES
tara:strand:- start:673 stop:1035 length:363 start_codon:yes stop_codon:yes gene_type:complete